MRKLSIIVLLTATSCTSFAQDISQKDVPAVVINTFQQKFSNQANVDWEMKKGLYEAEFKVNGIEHNVYLDNTGKMVTYKQEITEIELPATVIATIKKYFSDYKLDEIEKYQEGITVTYKVKLEKGKDERKVTFGSDGKVIVNKAN
jgi:predicted acylesterase/phospholipase RssA